MLAQRIWDCFNWEMGLEDLSPTGIYARDLRNELRRVRQIEEEHREQSRRAKWTRSYAKR
jgi:hypothetical protein